MMHRTVPWTSLQAYAAILPELSNQRKFVLEELVLCTQHYGAAPTASELANWIQGRHPQKRGEIRHMVSRRLPELADKWSAIHRGKDRKCSIANSLQMMWVLGPVEGEELRLKSRTESIQKKNGVAYGFKTQNVQYERDGQGNGWAQVWILPDWKYREFLKDKSFVSLGKSIVEGLPDRKWLVVSGPHYGGMVYLFPLSEAKK